MPVLVAPSSFAETATDVSFEVSLKTKAPAVTVTPVFLRIGQGTFITEVDFTGELDDASLTVTINEPGAVILVRGRKTAPGLWGSLAVAGKPTPELLKRREAALAAQTAREAARRVAVSEQRHAAEKQALSQQMGIESDHRALIEAKQREERESAEREVYAALRALQSDGTAAARPKPAAAHQPSLDTAERAASTPIAPPSPAPLPPGEPPLTAAAAAPARPQAPASGPGRSAPPPAAAALRVLPPPRGQQALHAPASVPVAFTPRAFPTPARESKAAEEAGWLARNAAYIKGGGSGANATLRGQELKDKGDSLLRVGDYAGAAHAYTAAQAADPRGSLGARLNRLVALLGVCAWGDASDDGAALLAEPPEGGLTAEQVRKVRLRTAAAQAQLGRYAAAADMLAAADVAEEGSGAAAAAPAEAAAWAELLVEVRALAAAEALKAQAVSAAVAGDLPVAADSLARALAAAPGHLRVALNACSVALAAGDADGAAAAHTAAAALLDGVPAATGSVLDAEAVAWLLGGLPPRRSPAFAQLRGELDARGEALAALRRPPPRADGDAAAAAAEPGP